MLVTLTKQYQAVRQARLTGLLAIAAAVYQPGKRPGAGSAMVMLMCVLMSGGQCRTGHRHGYGTCDGFQHFTSLHGSFP
ncbi:hypothetical protein D3C81_1939540 [compost metagenome]